MTETPAEPRPPYREIDKIPGWFLRVDMEVFHHLLGTTHERLGGGDLAELGAYMGMSASLIGWHQQPGETFTVIDLFEDEAEGERNVRENATSYSDLSQRAFEKHYLTINDTLPVVVRGPSSTILDHAAHGTHRFVHIDASHVYEHVVEDIAAARTLLKPGGVVVFDDYRAPHTPGVAAAVWQAVSQDVRPVAFTFNKLYATFDDEQPYCDLLAGWLDRRRYWRYDEHLVSGHRMLRVMRPAPKPKPEPAAPTAEEPRKRWWRR